MSHLMTKPTKWHVRPAKIQISLGIFPVYSESSLSAWRKLGSLVTHWVDNEDSDQTGRMPKMIWVLAGHTSFCWICHEVAHMKNYWNVYMINLVFSSLCTTVNFQPGASKKDQN